MERFNDFYVEFLKYIANKFPTYKKYTVIVDNPGKRYLNDFIELNLPYIENISVRNVDIFRYKLVDVQLIRGLKFKRVLDHAVNKPRILESIWRYLHKLYIVGYNSCNLQKLVENNYSHQGDLLRILDNHNIYVENIMLSGHPIVERSDSSDEEEEELSEEEEQLRRDFEKMQSGETVDDETSNNETPNMENMFEGSVIGNLAKELSEEINPGDLGDVQSMGDIVNSLMNPDAEGENKLQNIIKTVTDKMDDKMKNGEITQEQLLNDAQNMMGNMGQLFGGGGGQNGNQPDMANMMRQIGMMVSGMEPQGSGNNRAARRQRNRRVNRKRR